MPVRDQGCVSCSGRLAVARDHFGTRADVTSGRYPVFRPLDLEFDPEGQISCQRPLLSERPGRLDVL